MLAFVLEFDLDNVCVLYSRNLCVVYEIYQGRGLFSV